MPHIWDIFGVGKTDTPKTNVDVLVPLNGDVSSEWSFVCYNLEFNGVYKIRYHRGDSCDAARELLVNDALKGEAEWLFFLDSDVIPPMNVLNLLISHDLPIVSGIYNSKTPELGWSMWRYEWDYNEEETTNSVTSWDQRLIEVDTVGGGCLLIKKSVMKEIQSKYNLPLFFFTKHRPEAFMDSINVPDSRMKSCSEDFWFCLLAKACGFKIMVDTEVKCAHLGRFKIEDRKINSNVM